MPSWRRSTWSREPPSIGLPPTHIGIHTGPVIFQDGDVYGRTVNLASRIASHAAAGQVLVSAETAEAARGDDVRFEPRGAVELKGVAQPVTLFEASAVVAGGRPGDRAL